MNVKALTERASVNCAKIKPSTRCCCSRSDRITALLEYNMKTADDLREYDRLALEAAQKETMIQKMNDEYGVIMAQESEHSQNGWRDSQAYISKSKIRRGERSNR